jgi:hypothetical protein
MKILLLLTGIICLCSPIQAQHPDWEGGYADGCTTITAGKNATADGSVITSHTDDSHRTRSWMEVILSKKHDKGATTPMFKRVASDSFAMPTYSHIPIGDIPQVKQTHQYLKTSISWELVNPLLGDGRSFSPIPGSSIVRDSAS